jgi:hypothetical protein
VSSLAIPVRPAREACHMSDSDNTSCVREATDGAMEQVKAAIAAAKTVSARPSEVSFNQATKARSVSSGTRPAPC